MTTVGQGFGAVTSRDSVCVTLRVQLTTCGIGKSAIKSSSKTDYCGQAKNCLGCVPIQGASISHEVVQMPRFRLLCSNMYQPAFRSESYKKCGKGDHLFKDCTGNPPRILCKGKEGVHDQLNEVNTTQSQPLQGSSTPVLANHLRVEFGRSDDL